jgi:hypothetical protein
MLISRSRPIMRCTPATSLMASISASSGSMGFRPSASTAFSSMHAA